MPAIVEDPAMLFELVAQRLDGDGDTESAQLARSIDPDVFEKMLAQQQCETQAELTFH